MNSCCALNIYEKKWQVLPSMIQKRANAGIFAEENKFIYAFGGFYTSYGSFHSINSIEKIDLT